MNHHSPRKSGQNQESSERGPERPLQEEQSAPGSVLHTFLLCLGSLVILVLAFPPFKFHSVTCVALMPWLVAVGRPESRKLYWLSFGLGAGFYLFGLAWVARVTFLGYVLLSGYLGVYFVVFALIVRAAHLRGGVPPAFAAPFVWVGLEYARSALFTGFPWLLLGHSQAANPTLIQYAEFTGAYGVSFCVVLVNGFFYLAQAGP